jgi:hypothetical protein
MTIAPRNSLKENIGAYANWVKRRIDEGYDGHLMTFVFNQLRGDIRQMNLQMQHQIENMYASFLTRLHRNPHAVDVIHPILISCPDFPVPKYEKTSLRQITTNDGLHYHGLLLIPPGRSRLMGSTAQHFADNQSYYVRDHILNRIDVRPITHDVDRVTEATLPNADLKQKSSWVRALEYLASEEVPTREFKRFIRANGGLAGCARLQAYQGRRDAIASPGPDGTILIDRRDPHIRRRQTS